jgi:hypothetical protein
MASAEGADPDGPAPDGLSATAAPMAAAMFQPPAGLAVAPQPGSSNRGLDAGLSSMCPLSFGNTEVEYKEFRRRARLYQKACERRGPVAVAEGAMLLVSRFTGKTWDALEQLDEDEFDRPTIFDEIWRILDFMYKYDAEVEQPQLFDKLNEFCRQKGETLSNYKVRADRLVRELRQTGCTLPPQLVGHIFLTRSGVPKWQIPTLRAQIGINYDIEVVYARMKLMFCAEHIASPKDLALLSRASQEG